MSWQDDPQRGQSVWTEESANGVIVDIDYRERVADVKWHNSGKIEEIHFDEFFGCWQQGLNQWVIVR